MHHAPYTHPDVGDDDSDSAYDAKDEKWNHSGSVTDAEDSDVPSLPSSGYRVLNQRNSLSIPNTSRNHAPGNVSFPDFQEQRSQPTRRSFMGFFRYAGRNWSNILLLFVPIGMLAPHVGWGDSVVFVLNCFAIIPLADKLCWATESVSRNLGDTAGALVNVTMGNAAEMILFNALLSRDYMIVRTSLLGSIIVNLLLVLGTAILTGEVQLRGQSYSIFPTRVAAALLCLTTVSLLVPSTIRTSDEPKKLAVDVLNLSRGISVVLIVVYILYLWTQIKSSKFAYAPLLELDAERSDAPQHPQIIELAPRTYRRRTLSYPRDPPPATTFDNLPQYHASSNHGLPSPSLSQISMLLQRTKSRPWVQKSLPVAVLLISTAMLSVCGGYLVDSIDHVVQHSPFSKTMVGLIILPLVGNAAELVSGIMFASRRQMDLAFAISIGSAIQIALFVTPLMVVTGWVMGREMSLHFTIFEAVSLIASTVSIGGLILDNRCNMLKGVSLCAGYAVIALAANFVPNLK